MLAPRSKAYSLHICCSVRRHPLGACRQPARHGRPARELRAARRARPAVGAARRRGGAPGGWRADARRPHGSPGRRPRGSGRAGGAGRRLTGRASLSRASRNATTSRRRPSWRRSAAVVAAGAGAAAGRSPRRAEWARARWASSRTDSRRSWRAPRPLRPVVGGGLRRLGDDGDDGDGDRQRDERTAPHRLLPGGRDTACGARRRRGRRRGLGGPAPTACAGGWRGQAGDGSRPPPAPQVPSRHGTRNPRSCYVREIRAGTLRASGGSPGWPTTTAPSAAPASCASWRRGTSTEWVGIPPDADDEAVARGRGARSGAQLAFHAHAAADPTIERAYCDQGEKALLRAREPPEYDAPLRASRTPQTTALSRAVAEREERLRAARERIERYGDDDARMALARRPCSRRPTPPRPASTPSAPRRGAVTDAAQALAAGRRRAARGGLVTAGPRPRRARVERCRPRPGADHPGRPPDATGATRRQRGRRAGGVAQAPISVRENAPGWAALGATLRARGDLDAAADAAGRLIEEDEEDSPRLARDGAGSSTDRGEPRRAGEAWERSARSASTSPAPSPASRCSAATASPAASSLAAADIEGRIARIRRG